MNNFDNYWRPSFSFNNRMRRVIWNTIALLLFRYSPRPFFRWRSFILRCFGAKIAKGAHVYPGAKIWAPWNLVLGTESLIANDVNVYNQTTISIGKRAVVSQGSHLVAGTHDYTKPSFPLITMPIHIGDHVWIAADVFIHPGITIGKGCVIGARSVVTKNMPEWMVCSGHPCVPIKERKFENV